MEVITRPTDEKTTARDLEPEPLHYIRRTGEREALLAGDPFIYRALCGDSWVSEPGDPAYQPTASERGEQRICETCAWLYGALSHRARRGEE